MILRNSRDQGCGLLNDSFMEFDTVKRCLRHVPSGIQQMDARRSRKDLGANPRCRFGEYESFLEREVPH
jgi:hypothetical protein